LFNRFYLGRIPPQKCHWYFGPDVARVPLKLPLYSAKQIEMISTQDRHAEEKRKDGEDWRPRIKN
jgi:hypothetical protein